jgi:acetolactate synthase-1/2/3 large subunit
MSNGSRTKGALASALGHIGINTVFGIPGTQNLELFEALRRSEIRTILPTTETAAAFMANGYFRASGRPAAIATIPGPGFLYALTGLAEARHDSAALIHLVSAPDGHSDKKFRLQALDLRDIAAPIVKGWLTASDALEVADAIADAYVMSMSGEPGPVVVEIARQACLAEPIATATERPLVFAADPDPSSIAKSVAKITTARRLAILAGQGASGASKTLMELAELLRAPVVTTCSGRGVVPESHRLSIDAGVGAGGVGLVNDLFKECDVVLAIGCKFSHNGTSGFELVIDESKLIHVDASKGTLSSGNYRANLAICSDAQAFLEHLLKHKHDLASSVTGFSDGELAKWKNRVRQSQADCFKFEPVLSGGDIKVSEVILALNETLSDRACIVTDSGMHQNLTRNYVRVQRPRGLITPSDLQSTGFGLPAAIGAKLACPDDRVVAVIGDGSFASTAMEITTARREGLDLMIVLINDGKLGSIRMQQLTRFGREHAVSTGCCDCRSIVESCGAEYMSLGTDIAESVQRFAAASGVRLLEVRTCDSPKLGGMVNKSILREKVLDSPVAVAAKKTRAIVNSKRKRS